MISEALRLDLIMMIALLEACAALRLEAMDLINVDEGRLLTSLLRGVFLD